jgi:hypothetical protein
MIITIENAPTTIKSSRIRRISARPARNLPRDLTTGNERVRCFGLLIHGLSEAEIGIAKTFAATTRRRLKRGPPESGLSDQFDPMPWRFQKVFQAGDGPDRCKNQSRNSQGPHGSQAQPENARKIYQRPHHMRDNNRAQAVPGCECKGDSQHGQIARQKGRED